METSTITCDACGAECTTDGYAILTISGSSPEITGARTIAHLCNADTDQVVAALKLRPEPAAE